MCFHRLLIPTRRKSLQDKNVFIDTKGKIIVECAPFFARWSTITPLKLRRYLIKGLLDLATFLIVTRPKSSY